MSEATLAAETGVILESGRDRKGLSGNDRVA